MLALTGLALYHLLGYAIVQRYVGGVAVAGIVLSLSAQSAVQLTALAGRHEGLLCSATGFARSASVEAYPLFVLRWPGATA